VSLVVRAALVGALALAAGACVPIKPLTAPDRPGDVSLAGLAAPESNLVCVHEVAPSWMFDSVAFANVKASIERNSALKQACPNFRGQGLGGRWTDSYRTLVISLRDCRIVAVNTVKVGRYERDGAPGDFCAAPDRLALIDAPWGAHDKILIDTKKRPDASGNTPR
jgi:hypothetical protein